MRKVLKFAARRPWPVLLFLVVVTLGALSRLEGLQISVSAESMMDRESAAWEFLRSTRETFGSDDITVLYVSDPGLFTPARLRLLRDTVHRIEALPFVLRTVSLFSVRNVRNRDGTISVRPYFDQIPDDPAAIRRIRDQALANPLVADNLLSRDGRTLAVNLYLASPDGDPTFDSRATESIEALLAPLRGQVQTLFQIGGPAIRDQLTRRIRHDQGMLLPLSVAVLLVTLAVSLRRPGGALIPLLTAGLSVLWTLALMTLLEIPLNVMTSIVPALILVIGSTEDIHLLSEYLGARNRGESPARALDLMADRMGLTITLTFVTTYVGFLSIALNRVELLYQFGLVASSGLLLNFLITVLLVPALLRWFPGRGRTAAPAVPGHRLLTSALLRLVTRHRSLVWYLVALACALALVGASQLRVNNNPLDYLEPGSPVRAQVDRVHRDLSGIHTFAVVLDSGIRDTFLQVDYLKELRRIQAELDAMPEIDRTFSFADFIALVNSVMDDGVDDPRVLPEESALVREYMLFIKHRDVAAYVSPDFGRARILVRHNLGSSERLNAVVERLQSFIRQSVDPAFDVYVTGRSVLSNRAVDDMARGQFVSLALVAGVVLVAISVLFVNLRAGLVALVPNLVPVLILFGVMGFTGIPLDSGTSMVAAIALGICVDDTLHVMSRYHQHLKRQHDNRLALAATVEDEAVPILTTSLALAAGFGVLAFSSFAPVAHFGLLSALVMLLALVASFVITPLLLGNAELLTVWEMLSLKVRDRGLKRSPLLRGLNTWEIKKVLLTGDVRQHARGEVILRRRCPGDDIFIVLHGRVEYRRTEEDGSTSVLCGRGVGEIFGEESSQTRCDAAADVVAVRDTQVLTFSWERVHRLSRVFPFVALKLYRNLSTLLGSSLTEARSGIDRPCDDLTGLYRKEFFVGRMEQELRRSQRYGTPLCFAALDLRIHGPDGSYGLDKAPEEIAREVTRHLDDMVREVDLVARWNDGNPAVLLPHTDLPEAQRAAERLVLRLQQATARRPWRLEASYRCTRLDGLGVGAAEVATEAGTVGEG